MGQKQSKKSVATDTASTVSDLKSSMVDSKGFSVFQKKMCPGCKQFFGGLKGLFKKSRQCERCKQTFCYACTYYVKREVGRPRGQRESDTFEGPPKLKKVVLCFRCEIKGFERNESVVSHFENANLGVPEHLNTQLAYLTDSS